MKRLVVALSLLTTGCWTSREIQWISVPATAANIATIHNGGAEVTLVNGDTVLLNNATAYGDALCDMYACVRKADITAMRRWSFDSRLETADPALLLVAPLALPWLVMWAGQANYEAQRSCDNCPPLTYVHPQAPPGRQWLASGFRTADEAKLSREAKNPCDGILPTTFETDAEALAWMYDNRKQITDIKCLASATQAMSAGKDPDALERGLRMAMLLHARSAWIDAHCFRSRYMRLTPRREFDGAPVPQLDVIAEVLADDTTYLLPELPASCSTRLDASQIPTRELFAQALSPFSRSNAWSGNLWNRDVANIDRKG